MSRRKINENVIINIIFDLKGIKLEYNNVKLETDKYIGKVLKDFSRLKNKYIGSDYYLYLIRNQFIIREIDKTEKISQSEIKTGDKIIISDKKIVLISNSNERERENERGKRNGIKFSEFDKIETSIETIYKTKNNNRKRRSIKNNNNDIKNTKKYCIAVNLIFILILIAGISIEFFLLNKYIFSKDETIKKPPLFKDKE